MITLPSTISYRLEKWGSRLRPYVSRVFKREIYKSDRDIGIIGASAVFSICFILLASCAFMWRAPYSFPVGTIVRVDEGESLIDVANALEKQGVIQSKLVFMSLVRWGHGGDSSLIAGDYFFSERQTVNGVAKKLTRGEYGLDPFTITIPEGATVAEMAIIFERRLSSFDAKEFVRKATPLEGYLFPDTYRFLPNARAKDVISLLNATFLEKIAEYEEEIEASGRSLEDVVIMASIVEKEGEDNLEARRKIAGVLWKRIDIDMPLQVDAVFPYIIGRNTFELTLDDLATDSPYNTYVYKGLPPGPIANPGLSAIEATLRPIESDYLFYLADRRGKTHFAETFDEHIGNKRRYLD